MWLEKFLEEVVNLPRGEPCNEHLKPCNGNDGPPLFKDWYTLDLSRLQELQGEEDRDVRKRLGFWRTVTVKADLLPWKLACPWKNRKMTFLLKSFWNRLFLVEMSVLGGVRVLEGSGYQSTCEKGNYSREVVANWRPCQCIINLYHTLVSGQGRIYETYSREAQPPWTGSCPRLKIHQHHHELKVHIIWHDKMYIKYYVSLHIERLPTSTVFC